MDEIRADHWRRLRPLLDRAIDLEGDARLAYLGSLNGDDAELKHELVELLAQHERLKHRMPPIAIGLVTLAFLREEEAKAKLDDREGRPQADAYPGRGSSGPHRRAATGSIGQWFFTDTGPENSK